MDVPGKALSEKVPFPLRKPGLLFMPSRYPTEPDILQGADKALDLCYPQFNKIYEISLPALSCSEELVYELYACLVDEYRSKKLSRSSDNLNGISGILAVFADKFGWHFISGHPEERLERSLLWYPVWKTPSVTSCSQAGAGQVGTAKSASLKTTAATKLKHSHEGLVSPRRKNYASHLRLDLSRPVPGVFNKTCVIPQPRRIPPLCLLQIR